MKSSDDANRNGLAFLLDVDPYSGWSSEGSKKLL